MTKFNDCSFEYTPLELAKQKKSVFAKYKVSLVLRQPCPLSVL